MRKPSWIKCPSCKGKGNLSLFEIKGATVKCRWCLGKRKLGKDKALEYARMINCFAFGSYIDGGTLEELRQDEAEAKAIQDHFLTASHQP